MRAAFLAAVFVCAAAIGTWAAPPRGECCPCEPIVPIHDASALLSISGAAAPPMTTAAHLFSARPDDAAITYFSSPSCLSALHVSAVVGPRSTCLHSTKISCDASGAGVVDFFRPAPGETECTPALHMSSLYFTADGQCATSKAGSLGLTATCSVANTPTVPLPGRITVAVSSSMTCDASAPRVIYDYEAGVCNLASGGFSFVYGCLADGSSRYTQYADTACASSPTYVGSGRERDVCVPQLTGRPGGAIGDRVLASFGGTATRCGPTVIAPAAPATLGAPAIPVIAPVNALASNLYAARADDAAVSFFASPSCSTLAGALVTNIVGPRNFCFGDTKIMCAPDTLSGSTANHGTLEYFYPAVGADSACSSRLVTGSSDFTDGQCVAASAGSDAADAQCAGVVSVPSDPLPGRISVVESFSPACDAAAPRVIRDYVAGVCNRGAQPAGQGEYGFIYTCLPDGAARYAEYTDATCSAEAGAIVGSDRKRDVCVTTAIAVVGSKRPGSSFVLRCGPRL